MRGMDRSELNPHLLAVTAFFCFALMNACIKCLGGAVPLPLVLTMRFLAGFWCFYPLARRRGGLHAVLKTRQWPWHLLRACMGVLAVGCSFFTLPLLPLGDASALGQTYPFFLLILSAPLLGERIKGVQYLTCVVGFIGVLLIAKPHGTGGILPASLMILSALAAAASDLVVRRMSRQDQSLTIVMWFFSLGALFSWSWWMIAARDTELAPMQFFLLAGAGVSGSVAQLLLTQSFSRLGASAMGPYSYLGFAFAILFGWLFFGEIPGFSVLAGAVLIMAGVQLNAALIRVQAYREKRRLIRAEKASLAPKDVV